MADQFISAISVGSFFMLREDQQWPKPRALRTRAESEAMYWQKWSAQGSTAVFRTYWLQGGRSDISVDDANRLVELHSLAGSIGEQLALARTAELDTQRLFATTRGKDAEHNRIVQRAMAELSGHFVLGACHGLGNFVLRAMMLNPDARLAINGQWPGANGFKPGDTSRKAWLTFGMSFLRDLRKSKATTKTPRLPDLMRVLEDLGQSTGFQNLDDRRGMDYHRHRPQSVRHSSPRQGIAKSDGTTRTTTMPAPTLEPEADAAAVHKVIVDALEAVRIAMNRTANRLPVFIRSEGIPYRTISRS